MTKPHFVLKSHLYNQAQSAQRLSESCFQKKCFVLLSGLSQEDPTGRMLLPKGVLSGSSWNDPLCKMRDVGHGMVKHCCEKPSEFPLKCLEMSCFLPAKMDSHLHQFSFLVLVENVILKITKGCCFFVFFHSVLFSEVLAYFSSLVRSKDQECEGSGEKKIF